ncbi:unnamed protein product [Paramecium sonneborni]|uniref:Tetraspanin family protein n=1 Tax=Paramecium sonneborni TaxID=65129 RepID=A0A8S1R2D4_9CILI|nr:unnamed protein product [Paramecium sonneborni]
MCLPFPILKTAIQVAGWFTLVIGILGVIGAIMFSVVGSQLNEEIKSQNGVDISFTIPILVSWLIAVLIMAIAIAGIIGARKKNKCLLTCFNVGNCCCFTLFLILVFVFTLASALTDFAGSNGCTGIEDDQLYISANQYLCKDGCECYYKKDITPELQNYIQKSSKDDDKKPIRFQQCPQIQTLDKELANTLQSFEESLDCSGWCKGYPIKLFSDVNSGVSPNRPCFQALVDKIQSTITTSNIFFIIFAILFGAFLVLTCCLCCHPENTNRSDYTKVYE